MYTHILIATDGSELAHRGLIHGLTLAKDLGSKVTVLSVTEPYPLSTPATLESWAEAQRQHADMILDQALETASRMGLKIAVLQKSSSSPAEAIVDAAGDLGCDLIVMASHGRRGVSRLLLGSQTTKVVNYSKVPVLVVR